METMYIIHSSWILNKSALASCKLSLVDFYLFVFLQKVNLENSISHKDTLFIYHFVSCGILVNFIYIVSLENNFIYLFYCTFEL